ncbi:hypothetical protein ACGFZH_40495 [Streptomyces zaomyceticus]|uniref:hypothetical protein n=1 Tax=Streptomyces TaxID=1883 RepID=UPI0037008EC6
MSVRKTVVANQPDASSVKVTTARFDRFGRRFFVGSLTPAGAEVRARGGVRFGEYTQLMTNVTPLARTARTATALVSGVAR